jgi:hypothetical protein
MKTQLIRNEPDDGVAANQKSFAIIFDDGDEVMAGLKKLAAEKHLAASHFTAIGAFKEVTLGYFDWQKKIEKKFEKEGRYQGREEEVAARIVNKQRAKAGETKKTSSTKKSSSKSRKSP